MIRSFPNTAGLERSNVSTLRHRCGIDRYIGFTFTNSPEFVVPCNYTISTAKDMYVTLPASTTREESADLLSQLACKARAVVGREEG